jgi:hypothetical protein
MVVLRALADSNATHHCCGELWVSDKFSYIDDDDIKQIDAHIKRIKGVLKSSADVVATARQDLEEHRALEDRQSTEPWPGRELISRRATERQATPTKRRALFQRSMRTPSLETAATSPEERQRKSSARAPMPKTSRRVLAPQAPPQIRNVEARGLESGWLMCVLNTRKLNEGANEIGNLIDLRGLVTKKP